MHRPEKPTPRLIGITIAETKSAGRVNSVVRTEHYTIDDDVDELVARLDRIAARIGGLSDNLTS